MIYDAHPGESITAASTKMASLANNLQESVSCIFNGIYLAAEPGDTPQRIHDAFMARMNVQRADAEAKRALWLQTPEGIEHQRKEREHEARMAAFIKGPPSTFVISNQEAWKKYVDGNTDGYGSACIRYAAQWAHLMEEAMAAGSSVVECVEKCSHDADIEGITGFMYGAAVAMLSQCWAHGEALRRWHNKSTQLGTEGDAANASGGVLNPAMFGTKP